MLRIAFWVLLLLKVDIWIRHLADEFSSFGPIRSQNIVLSTDRLQLVKTILIVFICLSTHFVQDDAWDVLTGNLSAWFLGFSVDIIIVFLYLVIKCHLIFLNFNMRPSIFITSKFGSLNIGRLTTLLDQDLSLLTGDLVVWDVVHLRETDLLTIPLNALVSAILICLPRLIRLRCRLWHHGLLLNIWYPSLTWYHALVLIFLAVNENW